jgi:hypothetical protein
MARPLRIDADFPGGNIVVEGIDGDDVHIRQDLRGASSWWFYYYFRVRGAAGRMLRFHFAGHSPMTTLGPCATRDGGATWRWLGKSSMSGPSFRHAFGPQEDHARFCLAVPYVQANLEQFLAGYRRRPNLRVATLCTSRKGRPVERLHAGCLDREPDFRILLTARHHCCEMMASYAMEGILAGVLGGSPEGRWLRKHVEFLAIPFVDKDGVEDGDQGKLREPHDHARDYGDRPLYPETRAIKKLAPAWSRGRLAVVLDLHCPWVRGDCNEYVYFPGGPEARNWRQVEAFSRILQATRTGPLPFDAANNLPFGRKWNTQASKDSTGAWARRLPGVRLAGALEIPYSWASARQVAARSARLLGRDLARAIMLYLKAT